MENREKIVAEYFKLRVLLNKANLVSNEKTEIEFRIENSGMGKGRLLATLKGGKRVSFLEICFLERSEWVSSNYTGFNFLENFCANFLNSTFSPKSQKTDTEKILGLLKIELRSLGIRE